jgi:PKD repeat protein
VSWSWNFGDGYTGAGKIVTHTYRAAGRYTVSLTVSDREGVLNTASQVVNVQSQAVVSCPSDIKGISLPGHDSSKLPSKCSQIYKIAGVPKGTCIAVDLVGHGRSGKAGGSDMTLREGAPPTDRYKDDASWASTSDPYYANKEYIRYATSSPSDRDVYIKVDNTGDDEWSYTLDVFQCGGPVDLPFKTTDSVQFDGDQRVYMVKNPPPNSTIVIDLSGPQGANLDLYLREGKEPRYPDQYDDWSRSPGSSEHIDYKTGQQVQDIYIQVISDSGRGDFTLEIRRRESHCGHPSPILPVTQELVSP